MSPCRRRGWCGPMGCTIRPRRRPWRVPRGAGATAGGGAGGAGLADGVCAARGPAPGAVSRLWAAAGVHRGDPAWRRPAPWAGWGVCGMRAGPQGMACQGCGVPAGGALAWRARACGSAWGLPGGRAALPCVLGTGPIGPAPGRRAWGARGVNSIARGRANPGQAVSVRGPSNQGMKRTSGRRQGAQPARRAARVGARLSAGARRRLSLSVRVSAGTSRHSGEGCKSQTVKVQPTTLAPSQAQASVTVSAKR